LAANVARRRTITITNHWYVSVQAPSDWRPIISRASNRRKTKSFPTENEAKQFAKAMVSEGLKVIAGTLNPHQPRRTITAAQIDRWIEEKK
jgi:hypothetical protein